VKKLAVFASGRGSNFRKIYQNISAGRVTAQVGCLVTNTSRAAVLEFTRSLDFPSYIINPGDFTSTEEFGRELLKILKNNEIDWIVLAGYLKKIPDNMVTMYANRIVNIHPALLPAFGGKGMYGMHVHEAVFKSGAKVSGITVHLVNEVYDSGPVVLQRAVDIEDCYSPEEIAAKVLKVEHRMYSVALQKLLTMKFRVEGNRVVFDK
jgi:formyltetrahydrofolate-dependent phosphoribosylglycinamide formyltransferase